MVDSHREFMFETVNFGIKKVHDMFVQWPAVTRRSILRETQFQTIRKDSGCTVEML